MGLAEDADAGTECDLIIAAIQAAHRMDFRKCVEHLAQARQSAAGRRGRMAPDDRDGTAAATASEQAVDFFHNCYTAMGQRAGRNPGEACKLYQSLQQQGNALAAVPHLRPAIRRLVQAQSIVTPVQVGLCAGWEHLFRGNIDGARLEVRRAEDLLVAALTNIGVDVDRLAHDVEKIAPELANFPIETVICLMGISYDFMVTSSIVKLQFCLLTQKYGDEIEQALWIKSVTEVFSRYSPAPSTFEPNVVHMRKLMRVCTAFAEASAALIEAGHAAERGSFETATAQAKKARKFLDDTSRSVVLAELSTGAIFQEAILNLKMFLVPQMEAQWHAREVYQREIDQLRAKVESLQREQSNVLEKLSTKMGVTVNSTSELNAAISTNVETSLTTYDRALDQLEDILRDVRAAGGHHNGKLEHTATKIGAARGMRNVDQKVKTVKSIVDDMKTIIVDVGKIAPHAMAAFTAIAKLFGM
jgi:hypothetical protein